VRAGFLAFFPSESFLESLAPRLFSPNDDSDHLYNLEDITSESLTEFILKSLLLILPGTF
jgi:hypothetical protein